MTKQNLTLFANNKGTAFVSDAIPVDSGLGSSFAQVVQNNDILACAKDYLQLCSNLPQEVSLRLGKKASVSSLPSDVVSVEQGVGVLCAAYALFNKEGYESISQCKGFGTAGCGIEGGFRDKGR